MIVNKKTILSIFVALIMIFNSSLAFANSSPGSIHLYMSETAASGNNTVFENKESLFVGLENFLPGTYDVVVKSPGNNESTLGSGEVVVGESGSLVFNLYQLTEFTATDNKAGVYTVVVGGNKTKNFKLDYMQIEPDYWDINFIAGSNGSLEGTTLFSNILDGTPWDLAVTVPTAVPASGYQFDGWDLSFPETVLQDWAFTALFSLVEDPTPQDIRAESLILEGFIPIANAAELNKIRSSFPVGELFAQGTKWEGQYVTTGLSDRYVLVRDIDLSAYGNWTPIGDSLAPFTGTFDGNDYEIMNLKSQHNESSYIGLFGSVESGEIRKLVMSGPSIIGVDYVGVLAGRILHSKVSNIKIVESRLAGIDAAIVGASSVGGLIGYSESSIIENVINEVNVNGSDYDTGGIVGHHKMALEDFTNGITHAINKGNIMGNGGVGGIAGTNVGVIIRAFNEGDVFGGDFVGGIAGGSFYYGLFYERNSIEQAANTGYVKGTSTVGSTVGGTVGGIVGFVEFEKMSDVYNTGTIESNGFAGGIIGYANGIELNRVYSSSQVKSFSNPSINTGDNIVGDNSEFHALTINNGYYNKDLYYPSLFDPGVALDNDQMTVQASFAGFDFVNVWDIVPGESYPFQKWQSGFYKPMKVDLP